MNIKRVVIIGHKFVEGHSGTHSFIHLAYYRAFKHLNYETYWVNSISEISLPDVSGTLFFGESSLGDVPLRDDCFYVLHHVSNHLFRENNLKYINLCNYLAEPLRQNNSYNYPLDDSGIHGRQPLYKAEKVKDYVYYDIRNKAIYQPWATNLLPHEIVEDVITHNLKSNVLNFIGSIWSENINQIRPMIEDLTNKSIDINIYGWLQYSDLLVNKKISHLSNCGLPEESAIDLVKNSIFYPDIRGEHHINLGYIPCRLFKNISYGCIPITNSKLAYEFFDGKILYSDKTENYYDISIKYFSDRDTKRDISLIKNIKENHTYLNRVSDILDFIRVLYA